jgi:hypothetical protein
VVTAKLTTRVMLASRILRCTGRCTATARPLLSESSSILSQSRCYARPAGRFNKTKKSRVEVLEKEADLPSAQQQQGSLFGSGQRQQSHQHQQHSVAPSSSFPSYVSSHDREREEQQQGSQFEALSADVVEHMRKVYGTLAVGIGIAAGASMFTMATPLVGIHPLIPGIASMVPLMGIMYTSNHTHSAALRAGMFAAFTGLSGMSIAPLVYMALKISPAIVPQALVITTGMFGAMTGLSLMAKPGAISSSHRTRYPIEHAPNAARTLLLPTRCVV